MIQQTRVDLHKCEIENFQFLAALIKESVTGLRSLESVATLPLLQSALRQISDQRTDFYNSISSYVRPRHPGYFHDNSGLRANWSSLGELIQQGGWQERLDHVEICELHLVKVCRQAANTQNELLRELLLEQADQIETQWRLIDNLSSRQCGEQLL